MAQLITLPSFDDERGVITIIDNALPFKIARIYYITKVKGGERRGGHLHFLAQEAIVCIEGAFTAHVINHDGSTKFRIDNNKQCLILQPKEWHEFYDFEPQTVLMGISSTSYDRADYSTEPITIK